VAEAETVEADSEAEVVVDGRVRRIEETVGAANEGVEPELVRERLRS
jgi:hypothetical protein